MKTFKYLVIIIITIIALGSCRKVVQLPPVPLVKFTRFTVFDTLTLLGKFKAGRLEFYFEDGDGDLGLNPPADNVADSTDLYLTLFRKKEGIMVASKDKFDVLLPYPSYRIPYMERLGVNKILKGTISVSFLYMFYSQDDTIKYDFYIKDRAENVSDTASTCEIPVYLNGVYHN
ncbi:MAG TPA: hypothetical protein VIK07_11925 [Bacteroidales bacterium]